MPVPVPQIFQYDYVPETKEDLDWADLATIDLSKFNNPEGRKELTQTLLEAIRTKGFFYVINFGIPQEKVDRQYALGSNFYDLSLEEESKYIPDLDNGEYNGYRPAGRNVLGGVSVTGLKSITSSNLMTTINVITRTSSSRTLVKSRNSPALSIPTSWTLFMSSSLSPLNFLRTTSPTFTNTLTPPRIISDT
ncbi:flavonol synthase [Cryptococcus neoformans c45]|nr:flavonol synthase [Cryptococcus neoformans var. grubii c45]